MADRQNVWVYVGTVNEGARPVTLSGSFEGLPRKHGQFKLCKGLKGQAAERVIRELKANERSPEPLQLDMIPQSSGPNTIMGLV